MTRTESTSTRTAPARDDLTAPVDVRPAAEIVTTAVVAPSPPPSSLLDRLVALRRDQSRLCAMEKHAHLLAAELDRAAAQIRRRCPIHPPLAELPREGLTAFAARHRDLALSVRAAEAAIDRELERRAARPGDD